MLPAAKCGAEGPPTQTHYRSLPEREMGSSEPDKGSRVMRGGNPAWPRWAKAGKGALHQSPEGPDCPGLARPVAGS